MFLRNSRHKISGLDQYFEIQFNLEKGRKLIMVVESKFTPRWEVATTKGSFLGQIYYLSLGTQNKWSLVGIGMKLR